MCSQSTYDHESLFQIGLPDDESGTIAFKKWTITPISEDIKVGKTLTRFSGVIVDIQSGSGLIK